MEREAQKTHGNPLRNKYRAKKGDFVMFADDDNWCVILFLLVMMRHPPVSCICVRVHTQR